MRRLLVVIVTYNGMRWLDRCIGSVLSSDVPADIFVCDNGSTDGTADFIESHYPSVQLVRSGENLGFARANDLGFRKALEGGYHFVYLLNQDAWVLPDTFSKLMNAFCSGNWGLLSPLQMRPDLTAPDKRFKRHYHGPLVPSDEVFPVRFVMAAHWMISSDCLRKTGFFSPAFSHYGEDNNYCDRVRFHGFGTGVLPSAIGVHDRQARKKSKEARIKQNCQYSKVCLSNPGSSFSLQSVWQPLRQCLMALLWWSVQPLKNIPELVKEYPSLKRWRKESLSEGAFIKM